MKDINLLLPKVKDMAETFLKECKAHGYNVVITHTYRDQKEQDALYAQGRTTPGNVVTNAKFGDSMHNYKVAIDFAPVKADGSIDWADMEAFTAIGKIGEGVGFTWGGRWQSFIDVPHLQYTAGYTLVDFKAGKIDMKKFDTTSTYKSSPLRAKAAFALRDWQVQELGVKDFEGETNPDNIRFGPKSAAAFNIK